MVTFEFVVTLSTVFGPTVGGAAAMTGRVARDPSAFSRYGGVKICPSGWFALRRATINVSVNGLSTFAMRGEGQALRRLPRHSHCCWRLSTSAQQQQQHRQQHSSSASFADHFRCGLPSHWHIGIQVMGLSDGYNGEGEGHGEGG